MTGVPLPVLWIYTAGLYFVVVVRAGCREVRLKRFESEAAALQWRDRLQALLDEKEELD